MFNIRTFLPLAVMMAVASPLAAQDAEKPAQDAAAAEDPQKGPYFREESGEWKLECLRTGEEKEPCQLFQAAFDDQGNQLSNMRLFKLPSGEQAEAGAVVAVPLEVLLPAQMILTIDEGKSKRYPYSVCDPLGCYARIGFTAEEVAEFKKGSKAVFEVVPFVAPNERMKITFSLKGFTAGYDKIDVIPQ
ncbi:invasion associated locus B family protein [Thalassovita sp.]|uniref:invasion associated locus B family protein n=1 Tax=Thalassovita sp. TaxID=1979401 RepID=UPI0029DE553B|nr:invasion associated locus B family protein [Thalassovita sp.]